MSVEAVRCKREGSRGRGERTRVVVILHLGLDLDGELVVRDDCARVEKGERASETRWGERQEAREGAPSSSSGKILSRTSSSDLRSSA